MTVDINAVAQEFTDLLNDFHSYPEVYDNDLDRQIHKWYAEVENVWPKRPYFSPSSANSCKRELYMKQIGAKKDAARRPPHQGRWQNLGTLMGDMIQRDLLIIERQYKKLSGKDSRFRFVRDEKGRPMFEDFAKKSQPVKHREHDFYLYGTPDGVMEYITDDGELVRIGLEVKSKQGTASKTSEYSMREADPKHVAQVVGYSEMYDFDYAIILYVNASKKGWNMTPEDFEKTPDIRAFGIEVNDEMRSEVFDYMADVLDAVKAKTPPKMALDKFTFNNFKTACALSLTNEDMDDLKAQARLYMRSGLPEWQKQSAFDAYQTIKELRGDES